MWKKKGKYNIGGYVKYLHRLWDTTDHKRTWKQLKNGTCTLCGEEADICDHVYERKHTLLHKACEIHLQQEYFRSRKDWYIKKLIRQIQIILTQ